MISNHLHAANVIKKEKAKEENSGTLNQQVDYRYNIRGWLTRINNSNLSTTHGGPKDYFGMNLAYNDGVGTSGAAPALLLFCCAKENITGIIGIVVKEAIVPISV